MTQHDWIKSTLGHGETMCSRCCITNREAAVLGRSNFCDAAAETRPTPAVMTKLPTMALSVRQPWGWAIIFGGKDIENRSPFAVRHMSPPVRRRIAVHAAKGMTREEYQSAADFMRGIGVECPPPAALVRGAVIGSVSVVDVVKASASPWFFGPAGLVLRNPEPCDPVPASGALGYFTWRPADASIMPPPARWMLPVADRPQVLAEPDDDADPPSNLLL